MGDMWTNTYIVLLDKHVHVFFNKGYLVIKSSSTNTKPRASGKGGTASDKNAGVCDGIYFYFLKIYINEFMCKSKANIPNRCSYCHVGIFN
jgi:hypothetical protein